MTVVLASEGYPTSPRVGEILTGINPIEGSEVFHAGTTLDGNLLQSSAGRVLAVTGLGADLTEARDKAYRVISGITLRGSHYRSDIALNASIAEKGN